MTPAPCSVPECDRPSRARGWCRAHYLRWYKNGTSGQDGPITGQNRRSGMPWRSSNGYMVIHVPGHPMANEKGHVLQHRFVMAEHLSRSLLPHENIHHRNGDRLDNRIENLELWSTVQPSGQRVDDKVSWAIEVLRLYKPDALAD